jgi:hypothetical protein
VLKQQSTLDQMLNALRCRQLRDQMNETHALHKLSKDKLLA